MILKDLLLLPVLDFSSAGTTRGLGENEFKLIGEIICKVLLEASNNNLSDNTIIDSKNKTG